MSESIKYFDNVDDLWSEYDELFVVSNRQDKNFFDYAYNDIYIKNAEKGKIAVVFWSKWDDVEEHLKEPKKGVTLYAHSFKREELDVYLAKNLSVFSGYELIFGVL